MFAGPNVQINITRKVLLAAAFMGQVAGHAVDDPRPLDPRCSCYTCLRHSRAYLRHLFLSGEILYAILATRHNIRRYLDIMREIRHAIISESFPEYLRGVRSVSGDAG